MAIRELSNSIILLRREKIEATITGKGRALSIRAGNTMA